MATVEETLRQINHSLKTSGGLYGGYSCKAISWDDVQRGTVGGSLSCWGANITDTRLWAKDGRSLFTVRGDNWNERLGKVTADQLAIVASDDSGGGRGTNLQPRTLRTFLTSPARFGAYAGLTKKSLDLSDEALDKEVSVRFQTTFLPVGSEEKAALEFAPEAYNYNTRSDADPRNLILLCTTQGIAVQQDGAGAKKLYHHAVSEEGNTSPSVGRYWLEAEQSRHKVGGSQTETQEERKDALARGKATASVVGVEGMGTRFNALMTIQIPLEQKQKKPARFEQQQQCAMEMFCYEDEDGDFDEEDEEECADDFLIPAASSSSPVNGRGASQASVGKSFAARVSKGSYVDTWDGLTVEDPKRHASEHITATIVMYYVCSGGVPTAEEVRAAVDDLEDMYHSVESTGRLADSSFDFMKSELTVKDTIDIKTKIATQPPPKPGQFTNYDVFPTS